MPKQNKSGRRSAGSQAEARQKQSRKEVAAAVKAVQLQKQKAAKRARWFTIGGIIGVVALVTLPLLYFFIFYPYQQVILSVGRDNVKVGYFLRRLVANPSTDIGGLVQGLTYEMLVQQLAPGQGVSPVTSKDVDNYLMDEAKKMQNVDTLTDEEFDAWFKEQLANTGLPAKEFRDLAVRDMLRLRLQDVVTADITSAAPQVHLWALVVGSNDEAMTAKARIEAGEDFATVAKEVSLDSGAQTNGGDMGWLPPNVLDSQLSTPAAALEVGTVSDPIAYTQADSTSSTGSSTRYVLLYASEKSDSMEMTANQLAILRNKGLIGWLNNQAANINIEVRGLNGSKTLDATSTSWLQLQAQKLTAKLSTTEQTVSNTTPATETATETTLPIEPTTTSTP